MLGLAGRDGTQDVMHVRQVLYKLRYTQAIPGRVLFMHRGQNAKLVLVRYSLSH